MIYAAELDDIRKIILHFRDLILLSSLFNYDEEMAKFIRMLREFGYAKDKIDKFIEKAGNWTFFEKRIPNAIKEVGDQKEYEKNKSRY
jgi:hypothetical protein